MIMKNYAFTIQIPQPCSAGWKNMTPSEKGRHCASCAKEVVDFSQMSDTQVIDFYQSHKDQKICGHFSTRQLDRQLRLPLPQQRYATSSVSSLSALVMLAAAVTATPLAFSQESEKTPVQQEGNVILSGKVSKKNLHAPGMISGTLILNDEGISFGMVMLKYQGTIIRRVQTDMDGNFFIQAGFNEVFDSLLVRVSDCEDLQLAISPESNLCLGNIMMIQKETYLEGDVIFIPAEMEQQEQNGRRRKRKDE